MKKVYCVIGRKRVGKDTVADYICKQKKCNKYALALPLKELTCKILGVSMEDLDKYKNEDWYFYSKKTPIGELVEDVIREETLVSYRSILQLCGDEMKSFFGLDCFMRKLHLRMLEEQNECAVISDMRLKEEQDWLVGHTNPIFIKIVRDTELDQDSAHRTETEVDTLGYDVLVENNGTLEELYAKIDKIIK